MFFIRLFGSQLRSDDCDQGRHGVGKVVDGVKHNRDRTGNDPDGSLERSQKQIGRDADDACSYDNALTGRCFILHCHRLLLQAEGGGFCKGLLRLSG